MDDHTSHDQTEEEGMGGNNSGSLSLWNQCLPMYSTPTCSLPGITNSTEMVSDGSQRTKGLLCNTIEKKATIFKNPFDVPKDQLIRQLIYLPACIARALETRRNIYSSGDKRIASPFWALAQEVEEIENAQLIEKDEGSERHKKDEPEEKWQEDVHPIHSRDSKRKQPLEMGEGFPSQFVSERSSEENEIVQMGINCPGNKTAELHDLVSPTQDIQSGQSKALDMGTNGKTTVARGDKNPANGKLPGEECTVVVPEENTPRTEKDPHTAAEFIIEAIRRLRHAKPGDTCKLLELLSVPDIPLEKNFMVEQLIQLAHKYNKWDIAKELSDYAAKCLG